MSNTMRPRMKIMLYLAYDREMDLAKENGRKGLITKTWERCKSLNYKGRNSQSSSTHHQYCGLTTKSKSCPHIYVALEEEKENEKEKPPTTRRKHRVAPEGCFSVYVGPQKQRFVIKTEYANHPLFKMLLEESELEYGYSSEGPIVLPCNIDLFHKVLVEMDDGDEIGQMPRGCSFPKGHASYHLLSPSRLVAMNHF